MCLKIVCKLRHPYLFFFDLLKTLNIYHWLQTSYFYADQDGFFCTPDRICFRGIQEWKTHRIEPGNRHLESKMRILLFK